MRKVYKESSSHAIILLQFTIKHINTFTDLNTTTTLQILQPNQTTPINQNAILTHHHHRPLRRCFRPPNCCWGATSRSLLQRNTTLLWCRCSRCCKPELRSSWVATFMISTTNTNMPYSWENPNWQRWLRCCLCRERQDRPVLSHPNRKFIGKDCLTCRWLTISQLGQGLLCSAAS